MRTYSSAAPDPFRTQQKACSLRGLSLAAVLLAVPFLAPTVAIGQVMPAPTPAAGDMNRIDGSDRDFLEDAAEGGLKEVTIAQSVMPRLTNPAVRNFAETMVDEHTAANAELRNLAEKKGVTLPVSDPSDHVKEWGSKTEDADEDFVDAMMDDHEDAVERYEEAARSRDADIAAFAQKALPALRRHLQQAEALKKGMR